MQVEAALYADGQALELVQVGEGLLDDVAVGKGRPSACEVC